MKPRQFATLAAAALAMFALFSWLRRRRPAGKTIVGSDGLTYAQQSPATDSAPSIWRRVPDDGKEYFPQLSFDLGQSQDAPIFRSFS